MSAFQRRSLDRVARIQFSNPCMELGLILSGSMCRLCGEAGGHGRLLIRKLFICTTQHLRCLFLKFLRASLCGLNTRSRCINSFRVSCRRSLQHFGMHCDQLITLGFKTSVRGIKSCLFLLLIRTSLMLQFLSVGDAKLLALLLGSNHVRLVLGCKLIDSLRVRDLQCDHFCCRFCCSL